MRFLPVLPIKLVKSDLESQQIGLMITLQRWRIGLLEKYQCHRYCVDRIDFKKWHRPISNDRSL